MDRPVVSRRNLLFVCLCAMLIVFSSYWLINKQFKATSQELTQTYMNQYADGSETILNRAKFVTKRDGVVDIAVLGSSVTRGKGATAAQPVWGKRLEQQLNTLEGIKATVWNQGFNGYSTTDLLVNGKVGETIGLHPDIVIFEMSLINNNRYPQNDLEQTKQELSDIMDRFQKQLPQTLVLLTTANPTIYNDVYLDNGLLTYHQYNEEITQFVREQQWPFIDIYTLMSQNIDENGSQLTEFLADAVHPNGNGYQLWYKLLADRLNTPVSELK